MRRVRRVFGWLADYRNGAVVVASVVVALVAYVVIDASQARREALDASESALEARSATAAGATRRIDLLQARIADLEESGQDNSEEIGALKAEVSALQRQIEQEGGSPVVPRTTTTTAPSAPPSTTTTTAPPPEPQPEEPEPDEGSGLCLGIIRIGDCP